MSDYVFPPEVPQVGALIRITPVKVDYDVRNYRDFCEEAYVTSRFGSVNYERVENCVVVFTGGFFIDQLSYNQSTHCWTAFFDDMHVHVEVEVII